MSTTNRMQVRELLLQALEHERGGALVYCTALECALNGDLRAEWEKYRDQTIRHIDILTEACIGIGLDPDESTPGCQIVQHNGKALVIAMKMSRSAGDPAAAQLVACDCIVVAETKDHANWELIGQCAAHIEGKAAALMKAAYDQVEDEEDEHLYHTKGWCRELWLKSLGLQSTLPPPEEKRDVKSAIEAAKVEKSRAAEGRRPS
jgi:hypothetical protein